MNDLCCNLNFLKVTTKDGYILSLQRIPEGRVEGRNGGTRKQPVILQHGVLVVSW
jgi:lysosomal acid lipase/cholesteryl ester hydrolase